MQSILGKKERIELKKEASMRSLEGKHFQRLFRNTLPHGMHRALIPEQRLTH